MHELQLVGVHEDGDYIVLASSDGQEEYRLTIDDSLRSAIRFQAAHPKGLRVDHGPTGPIEVQAMIRAGATAEEAAQRAGWTVEKVRRYEGPILAEREHIAQIATGARLRPRGIASGAPILRDRVERRLATQGVDMEGIFWDSRRDEEGHWTVELHWDMNERQHIASWHFTKNSMTLRALDAAARALSEDEADQALDLVTGRRREEPAGTPQPSPVAPALHDPDSDLVSSMREHTRVRTRRRGPRRVGSATATTTPPRSQDATFDAVPSLEQDDVHLAADTDPAADVVPNPAAVPESLQDRSSRGPSDASAVPESIMMDEPHLPLGQAELAEAPEVAEASDAEPPVVAEVTDAEDEDAAFSLAAKMQETEAALADPVSGSNEAQEFVDQGDSKQNHGPAGEVDDVPEASAKPVPAHAPASHEPRPAPVPVDAPQETMISPEPEQAPEGPATEGPATEAPAPVAPAKATVAPTSASSKRAPSMTEVPIPVSDTPNAAGDSPGENAGGPDGEPGEAARSAPRKRTQRNRRAKAPMTTPAPPAPIVVENTGSRTQQDAPAAPAFKQPASQAPAASPAPKAAPANDPSALAEEGPSDSSTGVEPAPEEGDRAVSRPRAKRSRARRASVPAWDDIMFGAKPGEQ